MSKIETEELLFISKKYLNKHHQRRFELVMTKLNKDNLPLLSAVYLLTADRKLWIQAQRHIGKNRIDFDQIKPFDCSEYGYPLYCAAKDVYRVFVG